MSRTVGWRGARGEQADGLGQGVFHKPRATDAGDSGVMTSSGITVARLALDLEAVAPILSVLLLGVAFMLDRGAV